MKFLINVTDEHGKTIIDTETESFLISVRTEDGKVKSSAQFMGNVSTIGALLQSVFNQLKHIGGDAITYATIVTAAALSGIQYRDPHAPLGADTAVQNMARNLTGTIQRKEREDDESQN